MPKNTGTAHKISMLVIKFLSSNVMFALTTILFAVQAGWIALTGLYPMAFDEEAHLSVINHFTHHPNPFFNVQPEWLNPQGAVIHDPSYLYRYLMSIPYRLIIHYTSNFTTQVIIMRFINIAIFVVGIFLIRALLLKATSSKLIVNVVLLIFVLTPITTQLAAQINYDNLMIPLTAANFLIATAILKKLKQKKIDLWLITWFIVIGSLTSLVKYTYLTILIPLTIYLIWQVIKLYKHKWSNLRPQIVNEIRKTRKINLLLMSLLLIFSVGLFFERYGQNVIKYKSPNPDCVKVIGVAACQQFSIYQRGIIYANNKPPVINKSPLVFTYRWLKHMNYNMMMNLSGPTNGYAVGQPLPLPYAAMIIFGSTGIILSIIYCRKILANQTLRLIIISSLFYLGVLWLINYGSFLSTGRRVAIQGRYLVPWLPFFYLTFILAYRQLFRRWQHAGASLLIILMLFLFAGGGVSTYILHSDNSWYWQTKAAAESNFKAKQIIRKVTPGWGTDYTPYWQSSFSF